LFNLLSKQTVAVGTEEVAAAAGMVAAVAVVGMAGTEVAAVAAGTEAAAVATRPPTLAPGPASKKQRTELYIYSTHMHASRYI